MYCRNSLKSPIYIPLALTKTTTPIATAMYGLMVSPAQSGLYDPFYGICTSTPQSQASVHDTSLCTSHRGSKLVDTNHHTIHFVVPNVATPAISSESTWLQYVYAKLRTAP